MCLYPTLIKNRKYTVNKKNGGNVPPITDPRTEYVPIGCGDCIECRKKKAREWQVRLQEHIKTNTNGKFITLTFSNEQYKILSTNENNLKELMHIPTLEGYERDNAIAIAAVRLFTERWRKKYGKSIHHWLVSEIGHNGTENIHLHGIVWTNENMDTVEKIWQYGWVWKGKPKRKKGAKIEYENYVNNKTVNYIIKYITKQDHDHKGYKSVMLVSKGIGKNYINTINAKANQYNGKETDTTYKTNTGHKIAMPIYYRNKIYTEQQKEQLWIDMLDKQERWICGERVCIKNGDENYYKLLKFHQRRNTKLGYGNGQITWEQKKYQQQRRNMRNEERIAKAKKNHEYNYQEGNTGKNKEDY